MNDHIAHWQSERREVWFTSHQWNLGKCGIRAGIPPTALLNCYTNPVYANSWYQVPGFFHLPISLFTRVQGLWLHLGRSFKMFAFWSLDTPRNSNRHLQMAFWNSNLFNHTESWHLPGYLRLQCSYQCLWSTLENCLGLGGAVTMQVGKKETPQWDTVNFTWGKWVTSVNCLFKYCSYCNWFDVRPGESKWIQLPTMVLAVPVPKARQKQIDDDVDEDDLLVTTISPSIHMPGRSWMASGQLNLGNAAKDAFATAGTLKTFGWGYGPFSRGVFFREIHLSKANL